MKLNNALTMPRRLDIEAMGLFIPEPIEAWTLADFASLELDGRPGDDGE